MKNKLVSDNFGEEQVGREHGNEHVGREQVGREQVGRLTLITAPETSPKNCSRTSEAGQRPIVRHVEDTRAPCLKLPIGCSLSAQYQLVSLFVSLLVSHCLALFSSLQQSQLACCSIGVLNIENDTEDTETLNFS